MTERVTGYYWVQFNWGRFPLHNKPIHWEPASWDAELESWAVIGSRQMVPRSRETEIFLQIDETPIKRGLQ
jgi:hypothetical protein